MRFVDSRTMALLSDQSKLPRIATICEENKYSICLRCLLRHCNVKQVFNIFEIETLRSEFKTANNLNLEKWSQLNGICEACLNLLNDEVIKNFARQIQKEIVDQESKQFQLHISLPVVCTFRNEYFCRKFALAEIEFIHVKELFRVLLANQLESLLQAKYDLNSSFIIGMSFTN